MQHLDDASPQDRQGAENALAVSIGSQVRELRPGKGWSQRRLARAAGIAQQNLSLYERGQASPRLETLGRLLAALGARVRIEPVPTESAIAPPAADPSREAVMDYVDRQVALALEEERRERRTSKAGKAG